MKIAILGARGIPACYSGYDTLVEELSFGLAGSNEFDVYVYCRSSYYKDRPDIIKGVNLIYLPAPRLKAIESLLHSFLSSLHVLGKCIDIVYFVDPANAPFCLLLRLLGKTVIIHTNGLGWKRKKWGPLARRYYKFVEWLCARTANALVTDNPTMKSYYLNEYKADSVFISYGASNHSGADETVYEEFGLSFNEYLLVVARLEPENNTDFIIEEYVRSNISIPLVVVGDSPYDPRYLKRLRELSYGRVQFIGRINDQAKLNALYRGGYVYIHGHEVGGTNPSLLRAMHWGTAPLVINVSFNTSVIGDCGLTFEKRDGDLEKSLRNIVRSPEKINQLGRMAQARANREFTWYSVNEKHIQLFRSVVRKNYFLQVT